MLPGLKKTAKSMMVRHKNIVKKAKQVQFKKIPEVECLVGHEPLLQLMSSTKCI